MISDIKNIRSLYSCNKRNAFSRIGFVLEMSAWECDSDGNFSKCFFLLKLRKSVNKMISLSN